MSKISITRECNWSDTQVNELRAGIDRKLSEMGVSVSWQDDSARIEGKGVKGDCRLNNAGVDLDLKLDMFASMFKSTIEQKLESYLDKLSSDSKPS